jgi:hypothetical protein
MKTTTTHPLRESSFSRFQQPASVFPVLDKVAADRDLLVSRI